jgi:hypothetical protein
VLDRSGVFIEPGNPRAAAEIIAALVAGDGWRQAYVDQADTNLRRWNDLASSDRSRVIELLMRFGRARRDAAEQVNIAN